MQDRRHDVMTEGLALIELFFWPGQDRLARQLAEGFTLPAPLLHGAQSFQTRLEPGQRAIVLWQGPQHHLATCVTGGQGVGRALDMWKAAARGLLIQSRQNRRTLILVEADGLHRGGLVALADRLGHAVPQDLPDEDLAPPLAQALARLALHQDGDLRQLLDDLTAASLPAPDLVLPDLLEDVAAHAADTARTAALLQAQLADLTRQQAAERDLAVQHVRDILARHAADTARTAALSQDQLADLTRQQAAERERAVQEVRDLLARLADRETDLAASEAAGVALAGLRDQDSADLTLVRAEMASLEERLATQQHDAALLLTQLQLSEAALTGQLHDAHTRAGVSDLRIGTLEGQLGTQDQEATAHRAEIARLTQSLTDSGADLARQGSQLGLLQGSLSREVAESQKTAQAVAVRIQTLEGQLAVQARDEARRVAEVAQLQAVRADLSAKLSEAGNDVGRLTQSLSDREGEIELHRAQLGLAQDEVARALGVAQSGAEAAALRQQTLDVAQQAALQAARDQVLADHATEVEIMIAQVNLLQSELDRVLMAPVAPVAAPVDTATPVAPAPGAAQADPDYLDKALAKALAAARTEADQRARLERELTQLKAVAQSHTRHAADEGHNRRMFTLMNKQTTAALDEIARLSGAAGQGAGAAPGQ